MDKKLLLILNPRAGTMRANKVLPEILEAFVRAGWLPTVLVTTKTGDGTDYARTYAGDFDRIACIGGDGTFNEVLSGLLDSGAHVPIGYIPAGSTNDLAASLGLPQDMVENATRIATGSPRPLDVGSFNGRTFSYVAAFGVLTKAAYATTQSVKNMLGHLSYVLEGIKEGLHSLVSLHPIHMCIEVDGEVYEDDYVFGAISNATSLGGILSIDEEIVDMADGLFEILLVKMPKDPLELADIIHTLNKQAYGTGKTVFLKGQHFRIHAEEAVPWTLDGEYQDGAQEIAIDNLHHAIDLVMKA